VGHVHLRYLFPFRKELGELISRFKRVLIPEMNSGQLRQLIRAEFLVDAKGLNKIQGMPFTAAEIKAAALEHIKQ
jgi:2-oxoglutarate ferredoxin oxidoreductase subunit alpha